MEPEESKQRKMQQMRETLLFIITTRFPDINQLAKDATSTIESAVILQDMIKKVSVAEASEEAEKLILPQV